MQVVCVARLETLPNPSLPEPAQQSPQAFVGATIVLPICVYTQLLQMRSRF